MKNLKTHYSNEKGIHFLGYQSCIHGLYRMSDVALIPTRFEGESYPLCLIQAIQCGLPVVATDVGEIRNIVTEYNAGILIEAKRDTERFISDLKTAMLRLTVEEEYKKYFRSQSEACRLYSIKDLAKNYNGYYRDIVEMM